MSTVYHDTKIENAKVELDNASGLRAWGSERQSLLGDEPNQVVLGPAERIDDDPRLLATEHNPGPGEVSNHGGTLRDPGRDVDRQAP